MHMDIKNSERGTALRVLENVLEGRAFSNIALRKAFRANQHLGKKNRAFVSEIVYTTIRNLIQIDFIINHFTKIETCKMEPAIRNLLRLSVCQMRFMDKVPSYAAVNEAVELARAVGHAGLSGFVNGVLRNVARNPKKPHIGSDDLGLLYSCPKELLDELQALGPGLEEFLKNCQTTPPVTVFPNTTIISLQELAKVLEGEEIETEALDSCLIVKGTGDISMLDSFKSGLFFVMDPGAYHPVMALELKPGETLVDLCAAPGGKSFAAACIMQNEGVIEAYDISRHKVSLIVQGKRRLGLRIIGAAYGDALKYEPRREAYADAVLVDAPCSGLGTLRKHPEIKYRFAKKDIKMHAEKQILLLKKAVRLLKPGGRLVYSTCTITKQENMEVAIELEKSSKISLLETFQIMPGKTTDGFFVAKFTKNLV